MSGKIHVAYDRFANPDSNYWDPKFRPAYGRAVLTHFDHAGDRHVAVRFDKWFTGPTVLHDVTFESFFGYRAGCLPSGVLGFAVGELLPVANLFDDGRVTNAGLAAPISFDGKQFLIRETRQPIQRCRRLLLMPDGKATTLLCEPDARTFVEQQFGREASMPIEEIAGFDAYRPLGRQTILNATD